MTVLREPVELVDSVPVSVPVGWWLHRKSWPVHRQFYDQIGRPMMYGEYSNLRRARGAGDVCLSERQDIWRITLAEGEAVVVQRSPDFIERILPVDWSPAQPRSKPKAQPRPMQKAPSPPQRPKPTSHELRARLGLPVL
jgi:hypothetical protein